MRLSTGGKIVNIVQFTHTEIQIIQIIVCLMMKFPLSITRPFLSIGPIVRQVFVPHTYQDQA